MTTRTYPDFYIVGAPKCGTTAMYDFLRQHPELYLPEKKELLFFARDLSFSTRLHEHEFLAHFDARTHERRAGTAHTAYLQSHTAAREIASARPDADIIVMLRNPVEMLHSWHSELLFETVENIEHFESALDAESERRRGRRLPPNARNSYVESLFYTDIARFGEQVERYLDVFGPTKVHVVLHDDLLADPLSAYRAVLNFLQVDATFSPEFATLNANKQARSHALQQVYYRTSAPGHRLVRRLLPRRIRKSLLALNSRPMARAELPEHVRLRLQQQLSPEVERLEQAISRDLSHWGFALKPDGPCPR